MKLNQSYYGDDTRWFIGTIINHSDPEERGRVQVRIHGVHAPDDTTIPNSKLPWAEVMLPSTEGGVSGIGKMPQMLSSAKVFGIFLDGKLSQTPLVLGSLTHNERPSVIQASNNQIGTNPNGVNLFSPTNVGVNGTVISGNLRTAYNNGAATRDARRVIIMRYFRENNVSLITAAGITGNLEAESGFNSEIISSFAGEGSQGLAQWNPAAGRLQQLQNFCQARGSDWREFFSQLEFILHELRGSPITANDAAGEYSNVYAMMNRSSRFDGGLPPTNTDPRLWDNSTYLFMKYYERPASYSGLPTREQYARAAYEQYQTLVAQGTS